MNIQAHLEVLLTPAQLNELRASLTSERQELAGSITALNALIEAIHRISERFGALDAGGPPFVTGFGDIAIRRAGKVALDGSRMCAIVT